jgi:hypothetical protein
MKTYHADWQIIILLIVGGILLPVALYFDPPFIGWVMGSLVWNVFVTLPLSLLIAVFTYVKIENGKLTYVFCAVDRKTTDIRMIEEISMREKYGRSGTGWRMPRVFIYYTKEHTGKKGKMVIPIGIWRRTEVAELCSRLLESNHNITADERILALTK